MWNPVAPSCSFGLPTKCCAALFTQLTRLMSENLTQFYNSLINLKVVASVVCGLVDSCRVPGVLMVSGFTLSGELIWPGVDRHPLIHESTSHPFMNPAIIITKATAGRRPRHSSTTLSLR